MAREWWKLKVNYQHGVSIIRIPLLSVLRLLAKLTKPFTFLHKNFVTHDYRQA